jgi:F0F1-type ATP synthase membrane subunit c/vacuolar-type H+-ATPase subunit K
MMQKPNIDPNTARQTMTILWFALFVSQLLFLVLLYFVKPELFSLDLSQPLVDDRNIIQVSTAAIAAVTSFVLSFTRSKFYLAKAAAEQNIVLVQTAMIIGCALCEAVSLLGLLLAFAFDYQYFFLWFLLGVGGTMLHFPRRQYIDEASYKKL